MKKYVYWVPAGKSPDKSIGQSPRRNLQAIPIPGDPHLVTITSLVESFAHVPGTLSQRRDRRYHPEEQEKTIIASIDHATMHREHREARSEHASWLDDIRT